MQFPLNFAVTNVTGTNVTGEVAIMLPTCYGEAGDSCRPSRWSGVSLTCRQQVIATSRGSYPYEETARSWNLALCLSPIECDGGREWTECGGGEECVATCSNTMPMCPRDCYEGCYCPPDRPVWHHAQCITVDRCKGSIQMFLQSKLNFKRQDQRSERGRLDFDPRSKAVF